MANSLFKLLQFGRGAALLGLNELLDKIEEVQHCGTFQQFVTILTNLLVNQIGTKFSLWIICDDEK